MFGLSHGELGIVLWIVVAIVTARFWPKAGEWAVRRLGGKDDTER
ncbi:MAG TPA: hypothetical protein VGK73_22790 [Polyangiaceae bacterium]